MRLAVIADIHGNAWALEAVLEDIACRRVDLTVNLGDVFSGPLDAARTAHLLRPLRLPTVRGNHDRYLIEQAPEAMGPSDRAAFGQLDAEAFDWLRGLPATLAPAEGIYACHATPRRDDRYWMQRVDPSGVVRAASRAEVEAELDEAASQACLVLCGHTHLPGARHLPGGALLLNPGSVGCPAYDDDAPVPHVVESGCPLASYAIAERLRDGWQASFHLVAYDNGAACACAAAQGRPEWAAGLATGWHPGLAGCLS